MMKKRLMVELIIFLIVLVLCQFFLPFSLLVSIYTLMTSFTLFFGVVAIIFILILFIFVDKRTDKGNQEMSWLDCFKKFLKDYSVTKNYPIDSVILWEKYLVYGVVLGVSLKALSQLPINTQKIFKTHQFL